MPNKLYAHLFMDVQQMMNYMPNSIYLTLTPFIIFKGAKIDLNFQKIVPFSSYAKRVDNINLIQVMVSYFTSLMILHLI